MRITQLTFIILLVSFCTICNAQKLIPRADTEVHEELVHLMDLSDDKDFLVSADEDGRIGYRHLETGKIVHFHDMDANIYGLKFTNNNYQAHILYIPKKEKGNKLIAGIYDFRLYKFVSSKVLDTFFSSPNTIQIDQSSDRSYLAIKLVKNKRIQELIIINHDYSAVQKIPIDLIDWTTGFTSNNHLSIHGLEKGKGMISKKYNPITKEFSPIESTIKSIEMDLDNKLISAVQDSFLLLKDQSNDYEFLINVRVLIDMVKDAEKRNNEDANNLINKNVEKRVWENPSFNYFLENPYQLINDFSFSQDGNYMAIAAGDSSMEIPWNWNFKIKEFGTGKLFLFDTKKQQQLWVRNDTAEETFIRNVVFVSWLDKYHILAMDEKGVIQKYNVHTSKYISEIPRVEHENTSLDINGTFDKMVYSINSLNEIALQYEPAKVDPVKVISEDYYFSVKVSDDGTSSFCSLLEKSKPTTQIWHKNNQLYKPLIERLDHDKGHGLSNNGKYAVYSYGKVRKDNNEEPPIPIDSFLTDSKKDTIGIISEGLKIYKKDIPKNITISKNVFETHKDRNGKIIKKFLPRFDYDITRYLSIYDLENPSKNFILIPEGQIDTTAFSNNERYLHYNCNLEINKSYAGIFDLELREWKSFDEGLETDVHLHEFDIHSSRVATVFTDKTILLWDINNDSYKKEQAFNFDLPSGLRINSTTDDVLFISDEGLIIFNTNSGKEKDHVLSSIGNKIDYIEFSPRGDRLITFADLKGAVNKRKNVTIHKWPTQELIYNHTPFERYSDSKIAHSEYQPVYFHNSKELAFIYNGYGTLELIDIKNGQKRATLELLNDGDWLVYTPEGLFDANKKGRQSLFYLVNNEVILYDQIKEKYWETNLLDKLINNPHLISNVQGEIGLFPTAEFTLADNKGTINVALKKRSGGIGNVNLYINSKNVQENINPENKGNFDIDILDYEDYLYDKGINKIGIVTYDQKGEISSRPYTLNIQTSISKNKSNEYSDPRFTVTSSAQSDNSSTKPGLYGLFVGSSKYNNDNWHLDFADKDAEALKEGFLKISEGMYDSMRVNLQILTSESTDPNTGSNKLNLLTALDKIAKDAKPHDIIVLFFSGHGKTIGDDFYYLTPGAGTVKLESNPAERKKVTLSSKELKDALRKIKSGKQLMILDACHSGKIRDAFKTKGISSSQEKALEFLEKKMGLYIIASSEANQFSYETKKLGHGLLTFGLLTGMSGEAADDGVISITRLIDFAATQSENIGKRLLQRSIRPIVAGDGGNSFPIGFANDLKVADPLNKTIIERPNLGMGAFNNDPDNLEEILLIELKERGTIGGMTETFTYTGNTTNKEAYKFIGTYEHIDKKTKVTWKIVQNGLIVIDDPLTLTITSSKKTRIANRIIEESIKAIHQFEIEQRDKKN